jgi:hypothetical protein
MDDYLDERGTLSVARAEAQLKLLIAQRELDKLDREIAELDRLGKILYNRSKVAIEG